MSALVIVLFVFLAFSLLVGVLFFTGRKVPSSNTPVATTTPTTNKKSVTGAVKGSWWVVPLVLDLVFWAILYSQYSFWFWPIWHNQWLFWIIQAAWAVFSFNGRNMVNLMGRPEKPLAPKVLMVVIIIMIVGAILRGRPIERPSHNTSATVQSTVSSPRPLLPATRQPVAKTSTSMTKKAFVVNPDEVTTALIPAPLKVARIEGADNVKLVQSVLSDGMTQMEFKTKSGSPAEVVLWLVDK